MYLLTFFTTLNCIFFCICQVCVSPGSKDMSETKSTLHFGSRAMKIENTAYVNMEVTINIIQTRFSKLSISGSSLRLLQKMLYHGNFAC